ncbi:MAG: shikimate dehydrogenase [Shewanella sp.]
MTDKYALFGKPVSQSRSPYIHSCFAAQFNQVIDYQAILIAADSDFLADVQAFARAGGQGANVTAPYKEMAYQICSQLSPAAALAGAVNTLFFLSDGSISGDNTDGIGLVRDLERITSLNGKRVLLIGAGGAARGCILPLLESGISALTLTNRTLHKAQHLCELFATHVPAEVSLTSHALAELANDYDIIINSTSAGLGGELPALDARVVKGCLCYDMVYGAGLTLFNQWAFTAGAKQVHDGLGMLVGQAAVSFQLWRKQTPDIEPVLTQLRLQLEQA